MVQISEDMLLCVGFVGVELGAGPKVVGTFFLIGLPLSHGRVAIYAVTAAHVLDGVRRKSMDGFVYLRLNRKTYGVGWLRTSMLGWVQHDDPHVDIAVSPMIIPTSYDVRTWDIAAVADFALIEREAVGPGDEVFFIGLYHKHHGDLRNIPIVRLGSIAAMPVEPVPTESGPAVVYLIEARSIGGLSGSPVFLHLSYPRRDPIELRFGSAFRLLGLIRGHFPVTPRDLDQSDDIGPDGLGEEVANSGIALVTPVQALLDVLEYPKIKDGRAKLESIVEWSVATGEAEAEDD